MKQNKITSTTGFIVNGVFHTHEPEVNAITVYEFRGVKYTTLEQAQDAQKFLSNHTTLTNLLKNLIGIHASHVNYQMVATKIMNTKDGIALYDMLKSYFKDNEKKF